VKAKIEIVLDGGVVSVSVTSSPDRATCYGLLEIARDSIKKWYDEKPADDVPAKQVAGRRPKTPRAKRR